MSELGIANTHAADVNEIQLGFFLSDNWSNFVDSCEAKEKLKGKRKLVGEIGFDDQTKKAKAMAIEVLKWAKNEGYNEHITKVWWTARPNSLAKAFGQPVDSRKNPTDVLIQFSNNDYLGLSAKSTKTQGDISFKNPGVGTIEKSLGIDLKTLADNAVDKLSRKYIDLPSAAKARKAAIRSNDRIKAEADAMGREVLTSIRDKMYTRLTAMSQEELFKFIINDWMDAASEGPRYVKVTGMKRGAKVEDPTKNEKLDALLAGNITLEKVGNDSIGIRSDCKRIMKMRAKYESQKLASAIKFSGDP